MLTAMVIVFLVGYLMIALEHPLKINKAGTALLIGTVLWVMYTYAAPFFIPRASAEEFSLFLESFPSLGSLTFKEQCTRFVVEHQVLDSIGEIAETLIFLIGAMIKTTIPFHLRFHVYHESYYHEEKEETAGVDRRDHVLYVGRIGQPYDLDRHDHADP